MNRPTATASSDGWCLVADQLISCGFSCAWLVIGRVRAAPPHPLAGRQRVVGAAREAALVPSRRTIALAEVPRPIVPVRLGPVDWALATRL
eukprot:SAG25_NODE_729_length_5691_cov_223.244234_6_plen_91_part_00